jgi:hypothetical protein
MYIGADVKYPLLLSDLMKFESFLSGFQINTQNIIFFKNPFSRSRVVSSGGSGGGQTDVQTDRDDEVNSYLPQFANAPSNQP